MSFLKKIKPFAERLVFPLIFAALTCISIYPVWCARVLPQQDIYQHLAIADIVHNYYSEGSIYQFYFVLPDSPKPNMLYYYLCDILSYIFDLETVSKIILSVYVILFPLGFLFLLKCFNRPRWISLFSIPLIYNGMFGYGFVSFILAIPMLFFGLGFLRRFFLSFRIFDGIMACLLMILCYFTHAHVLLIFGFLGFLMLICHIDGFTPGSLKRSLLRILPFIPVCLFLIFWLYKYFVKRETALSGTEQFGSIKSFFGGIFQSLHESLTGFYHWVFDYFTDNSDEKIFLSVILCFAVLFMFRSFRTEKNEKWLFKNVDLEVMTIAMWITYFLFPSHIQTQSIVSSRHALFGVIFMFAWIKWDKIQLKILAPVMAVLISLCVLNVQNISRHFIQYDSSLDDYPALFDRAEPHKKLLKIAPTQEHEMVNYGALWHIHFFYMILKGGISDVEFTERPHNPVQIRKEMVPPKPNIEFYENSDWKYFDYLLIKKGRYPSLKPVINQISLVSENRNWFLFKILREPAYQKNGKKL
jgi:hypothetical protein